MVREILINSSGELQHSCAHVAVHRFDHCGDILAVDRFIVGIIADPNDPARLGIEQFNPQGEACDECRPVHLVERIHPN